MVSFSALELQLFINFLPSFAISVSSFDEDCYILSSENILGDISFLYHSIYMLSAMSVPGVNSELSIQAMSVPRD